MPSDYPRDGILLLCEAARSLEKQSPCKAKEDWGNRYHCTRSHHMSESRAYTKERKLPNPRCSHNELEKSRRAHLKDCMENLKKQLNFDNESTTRITMLTVLKKATKDILRMGEEHTRTMDQMQRERQRNQLLLKKKLQFRKRLESRSHNSRLWRERNRNYSECSVATTSSEDSEVDYYARQQLPKSVNGLYSHMYHHYRPLTPNGAGVVQRFGPRKQQADEALARTTKRLALVPTSSSSGSHSGTASTTPSSSAGASPQPAKAADLFIDGSSSDSGYEEVQSITPPSSSECLSPMDTQQSSTTTANVVIKKQQQQAYWPTTPSTGLVIAP